MGHTVNFCPFAGARVPVFQGIQCDSFLIHDIQRLPAILQPSGLLEIGVDWDGTAVVSSVKGRGWEINTMDMIRSRYRNL